MIHVRVQHHPSRVELLPRLLRHFGPYPVRVVEHQSSPPDPWAGYQACLRDLPESGHVLIVQDDAQPVPGFSEVLPAIAATHPERPVCLWMSAIPAACAGRARRTKARYVPLGPAPFVPLVAVLWPREVAHNFGVWAQTASMLTRADDGNAARFMRQTGQEFMVCVPSIVEHDDFTPTVKGGIRKETQGRARDRVALLLAEDARQYDW